MGGKKRGVMTQLPKWAFQTKADAEAFIKTNGGKIVPWAEALAAAREELVQELR
jgi:nitrous oxide reductase accessory protein NosL